MTTLLAPSIAPAVPSKPRNAISWIRSDAKPHNVKASVNSAKPIKYIAFLPAISASRAKTGRNAAKAS